MLVQHDKNKVLTIIVPRAAGRSFPNTLVLAIQPGLKKETYHNKNVSSIKVNIFVCRVATKEGKSTKEIMTVHPVVAFKKCPSS